MPPPNRKKAPPKARPEVADAIFVTDATSVADGTFGAAISAGMAAYERGRDLPRLLSLWPHEIEDGAAAARLTVLDKLRRALRAEKRRADAGHWGYDLNHHLALFCAYKSELAALAECGASSSGRTGAQGRQDGAVRPRATCKRVERAAFSVRGKR